MTKKLVPLYDIPRGSRIGITHLGIMSGTPLRLVKECEFDHLDGTVGICYINGETVYLYANVEVINLGKL